MKRTISKTEQMRINQLLDARKSRLQKSIVPKPKDWDKERLSNYEWDNAIGKFTGGLTHLEHDIIINKYGSKN